MIYVVTGFPRAGMSMMMHCLQAGGMELYYDKALEGRFKQLSEEREHNTNPSGFFFPSEADFRDTTFPTQHDGKVIMATGSHLMGLQVHKPGYRVLLMLRDPKDTRQSLQASIGGEKYLKDGDKYNLEHYHELMWKYRDLLLNRHDVFGVYNLKFEDVVQGNNPSFKLLSTSGWPIDPIKAAKEVDIKHWRFNEHGKA